jgi:hypothetical protein
VWSEAEEIASGKRGDYPFDEAGKKRMLDEMTIVGRDINELLDAGLLSEPEAGLLSADLSVLAAGVQAKSPTEMRMITCYETGPRIPPYTPTRDSLERLTARLPLLERLAADEKVHPAAVRKALVSIERDLAQLAGPDAVNRLPEADRAKAERLRDRVGALLVKLKALTSDDERTRTPT